MHHAPHRRPVFALALALLLAAAAPARAAGIRILPLGDSITSGSVGHATYRRPLWLGLARKGYSVDFVGTLSGVYGGSPPVNDFDPDHEGHSGWRTDEIADQVAAWTEATHPDVVLIHVGSNDVVQYRSPASIVENTGRLIDEIRRAEPRVAILLACIIPSAYHGQWDSVAVVNGMIPALAAAKNTPESPVILVDQTRGFDPALHTYDKIHPNEAGEAVMAANWLEPLAAYLDALTPRASFRIVSATPRLGLDLVFDASESFVPGGGRTLTGFEWSFDDGTRESGPAITHAFAQPGSHTVVLTVTDDLGRSSTATRTVQVQGPGAVRSVSWGHLKSRFSS